MQQATKPSSDRIVRVELGERSYEIHIGSGLLARLGPMVRKVAPGNRAAIISDQTVAELYGQQAVQSLQDADYEVHLLTFPAGDASKSLTQAQQLYDGLAKAGIERGNPIVTLGGGVTGDLGGFVAATWLRGVPFVQVPTTLEADVDASVGGKVAVNHSSGKNMIGAFYQPRMVIIDVQCLRTLERRELIAGLAESIKHGLIRDADLVAWHENNADAILACDDKTMSKLIERNCQIKAQVVSEDERESGLRAILNYGHTLGHAIESEMQYQWPHGACVAVGMVAACRISLGRGTISQEQAARVKTLLERMELPTRLDKPIATSALLERMKRDKKVRQGKIRFVLPDGIGQVSIVDDVTEAEMIEAARSIGAS